MKSKKLKSLLNFVQTEDIPIAIGTNSKQKKAPVQQNCCEKLMFNPKRMKMPD